MRRTEEIRECKQLLNEEQPDHLHIRRQAIVTGFTGDLEAALDCRVVSLGVGQWDYDELMATLSEQLHRELSRVGYFISNTKTWGANLLGVVGFTRETKSKPDYAEANKRLQKVADNTDGRLVVFIKHYGDGTAKGFGWIPKLDIPENVTIVTSGYSTSELDITETYSIGRLSVSQTVAYLTEREPEPDEEDAAEIHRIHDGNPVAIEIAAENNSLRQRLSGAELSRLWDQVYDDKISADEFDLLVDSSHLIDLDRRAVTSVTDMKRGRVRELLGSLERKGIVSDKGSGLFTTDVYVKRYTARELSERELAEQHRMSFCDHAEWWIEGHESRMQEMRRRSENDDENDVLAPPNIDSGLTNPNLFLAAHHLSQLHPRLDKTTFAEELQDIDADTSGVFTFGLVAQRFFFEEPTDVLQELSEAILGIDEDIENELFSGTLGVLFDFDVEQYLVELSKGWSARGIETADLNMNWSEPDNAVEKLGQAVDFDLYAKLPSKVQTALLHFAAIPFTDTRTARGYYQRFGKTARNYGLEEAAFRGWVEEVMVLVDELRVNVDQEAADDRADTHLRRFDQLNEEIRDRMELRTLLEENHSQAHDAFQQRLELIRDRPDELAEQYVRCGEPLEGLDNPVFAYLWYALGHELFSKVVLGEENWQIYGQYRQLAGQREEYEKGRDEDVLVVTKDDLEARLS